MSECGGNTSSCHMHIAMSDSLSYCVWSCHVIWRHETMTFNAIFYHDVGEISDLGQSGAMNLVTWRVWVMQPTTPSPWRRGHSWPQINIEENGFVKCYLKVYCWKGLTKDQLWREVVLCWYNDFIDKACSYWKYFNLFATCFNMWNLNLRSFTVKFYSKLKNNTGAICEWMLNDQRHWLTTSLLINIFFTTTNIFNV